MTLQVLLSFTRKVEQWFDDSVMIMQGRYAEEEDFDQWKDRLKIYGLDFRDISAVHRFADHIKTTYDRLDIIINNAAQVLFHR